MLLTPQPRVRLLCPRAIQAPRRRLHPRRGHDAVVELDDALVSEALLCGLTRYAGPQIFGGSSEPCAPPPTPTPSPTLPFAGRDAVNHAVRNARHDTVYDVDHRHVAVAIFDGVGCCCSGSRRCRRRRCADDCVCRRGRRARRARDWRGDRLLLFIFRRSPASLKAPSVAVPNPLVNTYPVFAPGTFAPPQPERGASGLQLMPIAATPRSFSRLARDPNSTMPPTRLARRPRACRRARSTQCARCSEPVADGEPGGDG